jgi:plasmid stabilization system protein ParE
MVNQIEWSVKAQDSFDGIINYLEKEWSQKEVISFVNRVNEKLELLRSFPKMGVPNAKKKNSYRTLIHKKVTLVYHYKPVKKEIVLITFWNNLQNPKGLKY